jgi:hypothetical protein
VNAIGNAISFRGLPTKKTCVAPVVESNVSSVSISEHGVPCVEVKEISARISARDPVVLLVLALVPNKLMDWVAPAATVKVPPAPEIALPVASKKETDPVQDGAVPVVVAGAWLYKFTWIVSVRATPTGGKLDSRITGVAVCARSADIPLEKITVIRNLCIDIPRTFLSDQAVAPPAG